MREGLPVGLMTAIPLFFVFCWLGVKITNCQCCAKGKAGEIEISTCQIRGLYMALFVLGCEAGEKEGFFGSWWNWKKDSFARISVFLCMKIGGYSFYMMATGVKNKHCVKLKLYRLKVGFVIWIVNKSIKSGVLKGVFMWLIAWAYATGHVARRYKSRYPTIQEEKPCDTSSFSVNKPYEKYVE